MYCLFKNKAVCLCQIQFITCQAHQTKSLISFHHNNEKDKGSFNFSRGAAQMIKHPK